MEKTRNRLVDTPIGRMLLSVRGDALVSARFGGEAASDEDEVLDLAQRELREYFAGEHRAFTVPLRPEGTPFQMRVWEALLRIEYGQTASYLQIAEALGNRKLCRAVGMANHRNPLPVFVPCHRVIGADGSLTGYAGGLEAKRLLLELERG